MAPEPPIKLSALQLLRQSPSLRGFIAIRAADELGEQMVAVAVGWYVYAATRDPMSLAYVGLVQFLPNVVMVLIAGQAADRYDRRRIIGFSMVVQMFSLAALGFWLTTAAPSPGPVYLLLLLISSVRAFASPSLSAILPQVVGPEAFPRAVAVSSTAFQVCALVGPALGGLLYAFSPVTMFATATALYLIASTQAVHLPGGRAAAIPSTSADDRSILAGIRYVRSNRLLLSLISLDLFAVLLGSVTGLLPIYAQDILQVGPVGLGWLRCAPGIGAAAMGLFLAQRSIDRNAGKVMLICVAAFGVATIVFAVSTNFFLSLAALVVAGGVDMVSVVIRQTLLQITTPDAMRGRVSAVSWIFIGASNELGQFESGLTAALMGTVPAALFGGFGTLLVVALWAKIFPELLHADKLVAAKPKEERKS